jgi:apolipoprotein N-acyltransferase
MRRYQIMPTSWTQHQHRLGLLAVLVSAVLFYVSTGLGRLWPLTWFAAIPVLLFSFQHSWRRAALVSFGAFFLGSATLVSAYGLGGWVLLGLPVTIGFVAATLAARFAQSRLAGWSAIFAFPAVLTAYDFIFALVSPNGTLWSLGYSQTDFLLLLQLVSLTGLWGIVFVVGTVGSAAALAWHRRSLAMLIPALVIVVPVLGYGSSRLRGTPDVPTVRVGLAATDSGPAGATNTEDSSIALNVARLYAERIVRLAAQRADIVVLPEKIVGVTPDNSSLVVSVLGDAARAARVTVIAGFSRNAVQPRRNVALVLSPDGTSIAEYEKRHPVPLIERDYGNGQTPLLFTGPGEQWGVAICKDLDFPAWLREYGRRGVRFLAVPAWDFGKDARLHARMAVVRGVENGFTLARSAQEGLVTLSDSYGRILDEQASATDPILVVSAPPGIGPTFYARFGDWFGWTNVLLGGALLLVAATRVSARRPALRFDATTSSAPTHEVSRGTDLKV